MMGERGNALNRYSAHDSFLPLIFEYKTSFYARSTLLCRLTEKRGLRKERQEQDLLGVEGYFAILGWAILSRGSSFAHFKRCTYYPQMSMCKDAALTRQNLRRDLSRERNLFHNED